MDAPSETNGYQAAHAMLLLESYRQLAGRDLIDPVPDAARRLFEAPFFVASHSAADDPALTYGNRTALTLFEMTWEEFTSTPSRFTAEASVRGERARLLERVREFGYINNYSGIRISKSGQRFLIRQATVWNLLNRKGEAAGQAATSDSWEPIP